VGMGKISAKYAILGLVIERPGYGYQLAQRLEERFGSSTFAPSGVYSSLDQLGRKGLVRAAGEMGGGLARRAAPRTIYEATEDGVKHFEAWMLSSSSLPPLRDELHMKIALCRPHDVPRLIDQIYGQELACRGRISDLQGAAGGEAESRSRTWSRRMRVLARDTEIELWRSRIDWLRGARATLEGMLPHAERAAPSSLPGASARLGRLQVVGDR
jgi:DNA-binding PadR family transcriptional regulator